jgi:hypothetical protein
MPSKYLALMARAMFVNVLVEGTNPSTPITPKQTTFWASGQSLPFSVFRDAAAAEPSASR